VSVGSRLFFIECLVRAPSARESSRCRICDALPVSLAVPPLSFISVSRDAIHQRDRLRSVLSTTHTALSDLNGEIESVFAGVSIFPDPLPVENGEFSDAVRTLRARLDVVPTRILAIASHLRTVAETLEEEAREIRHSRHAATLGRSTDPTRVKTKDS